ncbi:MAG: hypothetical protein WED04_03005 [Promethearchaeati archaeon SRVP18_Atabeyarchaeia-1]
MKAKVFDRILDFVIISAAAGFVVAFVYAGLRGTGLTLKLFAVIWLFIYIFAATLAFHGNLNAHEGNLRRYAMEWIIACLVGAAMTLFVLVVA